MVYEFRYLAPKTISDLLKILDDHGDRARILAGGTDLIPNIRGGLIKPEVVLDLKKVEPATELSFSREEGLVIGSRVTINDLLRFKPAREEYPALCACAHHLASHQIRNRATVVGNVVNASPCADMAPALLCLDATAVLTSSRGSRTLAIRDFFLGVKKTGLQPGEILERIMVPSRSAGARGSYLKLKRIAGHDLSIIGVLMVRDDRGIRFGVSSAAPTPVLVDGVDESLGCEMAVERVLQAISPIDDIRASASYRRFMAATYVKRLWEEVK